MMMNIKETRKVVVDIDSCQRIMSCARNINNIGGRRWRIFYGFGYLHILAWVFALDFPMHPEPLKRHKRRRHCSRISD